MGASTFGFGRVVGLGGVVGLGCEGTSSAQLFPIIGPPWKACFGALQGCLELRHFTCIIARLRECCFCYEFLTLAVMFCVRSVEADDDLLQGRI